MSPAALAWLVFAVFAFFGFLLAVTVTPRLWLRRGLQEPHTCPACDVQALTAADRAWLREMYAKGEMTWVEPPPCPLTTLAPSPVPVVAVEPPRRVRATGPPFRGLLTRALTTDSGQKPDKPVHDHPPILGYHHPLE